MDFLQIETPDETARAEAQKRWDSVAKPLNSLGKMEAMISQIAAIQGSPDVQLSPRCAIVFCGDHGVVEEGVSQSGQEVTALVAQSIANGNANVNLMAKAADCSVFAVDMGMRNEITNENIISRRIASGSKNMSKESAMSRTQAEQAIQIGIDLVGEMKNRGYRMIATGEMGIGNTTSAAALAAVLLNLPVQALVGRGSGLSDAGLKRKISAIERAISINRPDSSDPIDVLAKLGGFEIVGMVGAFLGGMRHRIPIIIDGVISAVAALAAVQICPQARDFMLASHQSREPAGKRVLAALNLEAVIHADMALGEGTGAVMLFSLLDMALRVYSGEHTFAELGMNAYTPQGGKI